MEITLLMLHYIIKIF